MNHDLKEMMRGEAEFFDQSALKRTAHGQIPMEADIRRATRFIPTRLGEEVIDPKMTYILEGKYRDRLLDTVAHRNGGRVLEVCCGPGWLALELGRRGQKVDAYDISPQAVTLARRMLEENPYKENFGSVSYHLQDVTQVDLGVDTLDAMVGWSAYHHLPNLPDFMERAYRALKPGGVIATLDDLPRGRLEKWLERILRLALPTHDRTYLDKIRDAYRRIIGKTKEMPDHFTPMEELAAKDHAVFEIADILYEKYEVLFDVRWAAFVSTPAMQVRGPDWFRYSVARLLVFIDRVLCKIGLCKGFLRIIIARKRA
jgi:ubiquinone/menaquinone biosynthesis C-methylase UbiE